MITRRGLAKSKGGGGLRTTGHSLRKFKPNLQKVTLRSDALRRSIRLSVSTRALRSVQKRGGLDAFLLGSPDSALPPEALRLKHQVKKARS